MRKEKEVIYAIKIVLLDKYLLSDAMLIMIGVLVGVSGDRNSLVIFVCVMMYMCVCVCVCVLLS